MYYEFYTKNPNLGTGATRIGIPMDIYKKIRGKFVSITINNKVELLDKISNENRFIVPKLIRNINFFDSNKIVIKEIKMNKKINNNLFINEELNLLKLIPRETRSKSPIHIIEKNNKFICFYKSFNGRLRKVEIYKKAPLEFCRLLGYYQAEGAKEKMIIKRKARQVVLTNTSWDLISDFINLSKSLIEPYSWKAEIKMSKKNRKKEKYIENKLIMLGIKKENIKIRLEPNLKDFSIRLFICSTILSDLIINFMNYVREELIDADINNEYYKKMYINFLQGLFAGDGNYNNYRNKAGGLHHRLSFYEEDKNYALDYQKLLRKSGIKSKLIKVKNNNMYIIRATLNWGLLLIIKELGVFDFHNKHKQSLTRNIKNHKRYKSHKYLINLDSNFDISKICDISKKDKTTCYNWLREMIDKNLILKNDINSWSLTPNGIRIKKILSETN